MIERLKRAFNAAFAAYHGDHISRKRSVVYAPLTDAKVDICAATRKQLQEKAREFERKNALVNRLADLWETYTVGTGLAIYPATPDTEWNLSASEWWAGWCRFPDLTSRQSFGTLQSLIARTWFIDGECFCLKTKGESNRPRLQLIEAHRCETPPQLREREGEGIVDGVEINAVGRPVAYWFWSRSGNDVTWTRIQAEQIIHIFEPGRVGQYRGIPWIYPVINDLIDLDDLQELEMAAAKDAADISNVIYNDTGSANPALYNAQRYTIGQTTATGAAVTETRADYVRKAIGGRTVYLKNGEKMEQFRSDRPSVVTREFWRSLEDKICAGVGIPRVLVYPDSMQGTVYRGALDAADAFFRSRSSVMQAVIADIYGWVMTWAMRVEMQRSYQDNFPQLVTIHPPRSVNVDIGYSSKAAIEEIQAGLGGKASWYGARGRDWRADLRQIFEEEQFQKQLEAEYGFKLTASASGSVGDSASTPANAAQPQPEEQTA